MAEARNRTSGTANAVAAAGARPARRPPSVDATADRRRQELADALEQAQAIKYDQPLLMTPPPKATKPPRVKKTKWRRERFSLPEAERARIGELKQRLGGAYKKGELLRAGLAVLGSLGDAELARVMEGIERARAGRRGGK